MLQHWACCPCSALVQKSAALWMARCGGNAALSGHYSFGVCPASLGCVKYARLFCCPQEAV